MNNYRELRKTICLIGIFVVAVLFMQNMFVVLGPAPESPEMSRAKASVLVKEAEARLQFEWLKQTIFVGIAALVSGVILVSCSLWAATRITWNGKNRTNE